MSLPRLVTALRGFRSFRPNLTFFRSYQYKPGEQTRLAEALETATHRDIVLFRYEDALRIRRYNMAALVMFPMWTYLGYFAFTLKKKFAPYKERMKNNWVVNQVMTASRGVGFMFFLFGISLSTYWIARSMCTVRRLVLRKGGRLVSITTYGLWGKNSVTCTVPVNQCKVVHRTFQAKQRLFLNVKDHSLKYQFNVEKGIFSNKPLFDKTVGIGRNW